MSLRGGGYTGIGLVILSLTAALLYQAKHSGLTVDEPSHFAAAYAYWLGEDILIPADTPPLSRMIGGWVPRVMGAADPRQSKYWASRDAYPIGYGILGNVEKRGRRLLFFSRLPFLLFPLGIVFVVWHWGRQLYGELTALLIAVCVALEPTVSGHGALINSDVPSAFSALLFAYAAWRYWTDPGVRRLLLLTSAIAIAVLTKFTLLPLFFIGYALALWRGPRLFAAALIPIATWAAILASGQFQAQPISPEKLATILGPGVPAWVLPMASVPARLPWPTQFVEGLDFITSTLRGGGYTGYMLGHKIYGWTPGYFPLAWAVKVPVALQLLTVVGLAGFVIRVFKSRLQSAEVFIWGLGLLFFGLGMASNFHIGFRHVMPALPLLILGSGGMLDHWLASRLGRAAVLLGMVWLVFASANVYPQGVAYFNEWAGGPKNGWRYLADSNIDWGQNYPELGLYMKRNDVKEARCFLFGYDNPWHYMWEGTLSPQEWPTAEMPGTARYHPLPGTYAISVNVLTGLLLPPGQENYLEEFRGRTPTAYAGYSILIYNVE